MNELSLEFQGHFCNAWPSLQIVANDQIIHDAQIQTLALTIPLVDDANEIVIRHHSKRFGQARIWDTIAKNGVILHDRRIELIAFSLDGVDLMPILPKLEFVQERQDQEPTVGTCTWTGRLDFNGAVTILISPSPMNWAIDMLHKKPQTYASYFSDHTRLFHHEQDRKLISEIRAMLDDIKV